jgi:hypothetical protein
VAEPVKPAEPVLEVFNTEWSEATAEEQAAFLEANPEAADLQKKYDKANAAARKKMMPKHSSLAGRTFKHKWAETTPEEKVAVLGSNLNARKHVKDLYNKLTPKQRLELVKEQPSVLRKALHQKWDEATGEEKAAFIHSQPDLRKSITTLFSITAGKKSLDDANLSQQAQFTKIISTLGDESKARWQEASPTERAQLVTKWNGWKLKQSDIGMPKGASASSKASKKKEKPSKKAAKKPKGKKGKKAKKAADDD